MLRSLSGSGDWSSVCERPGQWTQRQAQLHTRHTDVTESRHRPGHDHWGHPGAEVKVRSHWRLGITGISNYAFKMGQIYKSGKSVDICRIGYGRNNRVSYRKLPRTNEDINNLTTLS